MNAKKITFTGFFIALALVLPIAFHHIPDGGRVFLPMHIPVLICGMLLGGTYGLICGIISPILSSSLTGMPPAMILPAMTVELAIYGFLTGFLMKKLKQKNCKDSIRIYLSLIIAMLIGRIASGCINAFILMAGKYTMKMWIAGSFVKGLPGIAVQIILIPLIVKGIEKTGVLER